MIKRGFQRLVSFVAASFFTAFTVLVPGRAFAFAPVAVLAAPQIVTAGGSYAVAALAGAIGLTGLYLMVEDEEGNGARVPVSVKPESVPPAPPPPPPTPAKILYNIDSFSGPDPDAVCAAYANPSRWAAQCHDGVSGVPVTGYQYIPYSSTSGGTCRVIWGSCTSLVKNVSATWLDCPNGTNRVGDSCFATGDPRGANKDLYCDVLLNNGQFAYMQDLDCPAAGSYIDHSKGVPMIRGEGKELLMYGKDSMGRPIIVDATLNSNGTQMVIDVKTQVGLNVQTQTANIDTQSGQVTSASTSLSPGTITAPVTSPAVTTSPGTTATTPTASTSSTSSPSIQFPDDYAREPTTQAIKTSTELISNSFKPASNTPDPEVPADTKFKDAFFKDTFKDITEWRLPDHSPQCPTGSFHFNGYSYTINSHCELASNHMYALQAAMTVVYSLAALFIVLRA